MIINTSFALPWMFKKLPFTDQAWPGPGGILRVRKQCKSLGSACATEQVKSQAGIHHVTSAQKYQKRKRKELLFAKNLKYGAKEKETAQLSKKL